MNPFEQVSLPKSQDVSSDNERLTEKEALLLQTKATEKEGIEFSEQAREESYAEAQLYLDYLKAKGVVLENLDLKNISLKDSAQLEKLEDALLKKIDVISQEGKSSRILNKIADVVNLKGMKKIISLLALLASVSVMVDDANAGDVYTYEKKDSHSYVNLQTQEKCITGNVQKFKFGATDITFQYDQQGNARSFQSHSERVISQNERAQIETIFSRMVSQSLDADLVGTLNENGFPGSVNLIKSNIKLTSMRLLENVGIYRNLMQMGKISEAKLIRETMAKTINQQEEAYKIKIYDRSFIRGMLDASMSDNM